MSGIRRLAPDLGPVILLTLVGLATTLDPENGDGTVIDTLLVPFVTVPVFWWRRAPLPAALALAAGIVISGAPTFDQIRCGFAMPGALLILFGLAAWQERRPALIGLAAIEGGVAFLLFTDTLLDPSAAFLLVLCALVWGAGRLYRERGQLAAQLAERTDELERTREEVAHIAADVERARIAGDIDLAIRDGLRELVALADAGQTGAADFAAIEAAGRDLLASVRKLLGVLHEEHSEGGPHD